MTVVSVMTGASLWEAGAVALIEPKHKWFMVLCTALYGKNLTHDGNYNLQFVILVCIHFFFFFFCAVCLYRLMQIAIDKYGE